MINQANEALNAIHSNLVAPQRNTHTLHRSMVQLNQQVEKVFMRILNITSGENLLLGQDFQPLLHARFNGASRKGRRAHMDRPLQS